MSETKKEHTFPHQKSEEVPLEDLREFVESHPDLYPGALGEAARRLVEIDEPVDDSANERDRSSSVEILDSDGWSRLVIDTPAQGVKVMFKGRHDLPRVEMIGADAVGVSIRPLYHDEPTGLLGGVRSEQQTTYAGSHGSDPRLIMQGGGTSTVVDRALMEAEGRDVILICDETPQGLRILFQAIKGLVGESELSELAKRISSTSYTGLEDPPEYLADLFTELSMELGAALTSEDLTPHEALELVFSAHVGPEDTRKVNSKKLGEIIRERLKKDHLGGDEPESHQKRKEKLIEALNNPERRDYWVHRDKGILRPEDRILTGGSYVDYPRYTTHGCLNVAIDVEKNLYGSGGHGVAGESGSTTVASPMGAFVEVNGMPVNLEAADTYFINHNGLVIPEGSLLVTVSPDEPPEDLSSNEIWIPLTITDEDIKNGVLQQIADRISQSIFMSVLSEEEKGRILYEVERIIRQADLSFETQTLASSAIAQGEVDRIARAKKLTKEEEWIEYYKLTQELLSPELEKLVIIDGVELKDFPYSDNAKKEAVRAALVRLMSDFRIYMVGDSFTVNASGGLNVPLEVSEQIMGAGGLDSMLSALKNSGVFKKLSLEKQQHFLQALRTYFNSLPSDSILSDRDSYGGYSHEMGYWVEQKAREVIYSKLKEMDKTLPGGEKDRYKLQEQARESELAKSLGEGERLNESAAVLAISEGGSDEEIKARYYEIINQCFKQACGLVRAERLRHWVTYNIIDQDEFRSLYTEILETNLEKARSQRRSDLLQVRLVNGFIEKTRDKPTPKLETFGRGLNWDLPGAAEQIREDYELAESVGLETARHAESLMSSNESIFYSELKKVKEGIADKPEKVSYKELIDLLKRLPLGLAARYIRAGMVSFDQDERHDVSRDGEGFFG